MKRNHQQSDGSTLGIESIDLYKNSTINRKSFLVQLQKIPIVTDLDFTDQIEWVWKTNTNQSMVFNKHNNKYYKETSIKQVYWVTQNREECTIGFIKQIYKNGVVKILFT